MYWTLCVLLTVLSAASGAVLFFLAEELTDSAPKQKQGKDKERIKKG